jgi:hypothetical protein
MGDAGGETRKRRCADGQAYPLSSNPVVSHGVLYRFTSDPPATRGAADARKRGDVRWGGGWTACRSDLARAQPGIRGLRTLETDHPTKVEPCGGK